MSRRFAAIKLLEHGSLTLAEFHVITGWRYRSCGELLCELVRDGVALRLKRGKYELTNAI